MHSLEDLGWDPFFDQQLTEDERRLKQPARVVWEGRERYRLSTGDTEWLGELAGRLRHELDIRRRLSDRWGLGRDHRAT